MHKRREKVFIDTDAVRDVRHVERAKFVPCRPADLVQGVDVATMRVFSAPVFAEICSWSQADSFRTDVGVNVFNEVRVDFITNF